MRVFRKLAYLATVFVTTGATAHAACREGELTFSFTSLDIRSAFAVFADYRGYRLNIDPAISGIYPISFPCTQWSTAVKNLADKYKLNHRVENQTLYVSKM